MGNWPTEPPSGNPVVYLQYHVYSRDPADTAALRTTYNGYGVLRSPAFIRDELGILDTAIGWNVDTADRWINFPYPPRVVGRTIGTGAWEAPIPVQGTVVYPSDRSGNPYWWPPLSVTYDYNQDWFVVPAHPSVPIWGAGRDITYIWSAIFLAAGGQTTEEPTIDQPIVVRRGISGAETGRGGTEAGLTFGFGSPEGDTGTSRVYSRDASRTVDGVGWALRSNTDPIRKNVVSPTNGFKGWSQIYVRARYYPAAASKIIDVEFDGPSSSTHLALMPDGAIRVVFTNQLGAESIGGTTAANTLPLNVWKRIDIIWLNTLLAGPPPKPVTCSLDLYVNKSHLGNFGGTVHTANNQVLVIDRESLGEDAANTMGIDLDDWTIREHPSIADNIINLNRIDWVLGSHMQLIRPTALGSGSSVDWLGDFRIALQNPAMWATEEFTSATSGARLELDTELDGDELNGRLNILRQFGAASFVVGIASIRTINSTTGELGYKIGAEADVLVTQTDQQNRLDGYRALVNISAGSAEPQNIEPLKLVYLHSTDASAEELREFQVVVEFLGSWGPEDDNSPGSPGITDVIGIHNGPYVTAFLGNVSPPPINHVGVGANTYVGNGTGIDINIQLPGIHLLWIRNTAVDDWNIWTTSVLGNQYLTPSSNIFPANAVQVMLEPDGSTTVRIAGGHVGANQAGVTYQYIAFSDPTSRFMLNGAFRDTATAASFISTLFNSDFTPEAGIFLGQAVADNLALDRIYIKGPGNAAGQLNPFAATQQNGMTFAAGQITSTNQLHGSTLGVGYSLLRMNDGSGAGQAIFIGQYIGNGVSPRVIPVDLQGRRPLFAIGKEVTGTNMFFRDPSNTGTNSTNVSGASAVNGFTAGGIDSITVQSGLNTNLVVYNLIIIPSCSDTAGNGGWGINETCGLAEIGWNETPTPIPFFPEEPPFFEAPLDPPADISIVGEGGLILSGDPAKLIIKDMSGIYTLVPGKTNDTVYDRQTGQTSVDLAIPDPTGITGYV